MMVIHSDKMLAAGAAPEGPLAVEVFTLHVLAAGFILTSLIWAGMTASLIDRHLLRATLWALAAGGMTLFGVIHSPFPGGRLFVPWDIGELPAEAAGRGPLSMAAGYLLLAMTFALWRFARGKEPDTPHTEETAM
jgi:AGZA family xanthine/uracil permease-like MFS transporter